MALIADTRDAVGHNHNDRSLAPGCTTNGLLTERKVVWPHWSAATSLQQRAYDKRTQASTEPIQDRKEADRRGPAWAAAICSTWGGSGVYV